MSRNLSEHKLAEKNARLYEEALQKNALLEGRVNDLEEANAKLKDVERMKSMFIESMSHVLRTPLNTIIGFIGIMLQGMAGEINPEQKDMLSRSYEASIHLLALISDVIDISKLEAGQIDVFPEEFTLQSLIDEAVAAIKTEADKKGLSLEINAPINRPIRTDRKRLLQCLSNYLSNALKFTENGKITVSAVEYNGSVEISVKDTGIGIKTEAVPALFNSLVSLDSPLKMSTQGTGLGLYLTKKIATEILKGEVHANSTLGKGSVFAIKIPCML